MNEKLKYKKLCFPTYQDFVKTEPCYEIHYEPRYNEITGENDGIRVEEPIIHMVYKGVYSIRQLVRCVNYPPIYEIVACINGTRCESFECTEDGYNKAVEYLKNRHADRCYDLLNRFRF